MQHPVLANLRQAVLVCDPAAAKRWAEEAIQQDIDPMVALDAMTVAIRQVGDAFGRGDLWLPELVGSASAMKNALPTLEAKIKQSGAIHESLGMVVIGTVYGDIHDIGKTMVATMLIAEGFTVCDLGVNIPAEQFVAAVKDQSADILAMSAIMTMALPQMRRVIEMLEAAGLRNRTKIMLGGAAITQGVADAFGADGYDPTAPGAAKLARRLLEV